jgi:hypothetical protein
VGTAFVLPQYDGADGDMETMQQQQQQQQQQPDTMGVGR